MAKKMGIKKKFAIYLIFMMMLSAMISVIPPINAAQYDTYLHITAAPNPVGVNQKLDVVVIFSNIPPAQLPLDTPRYGYWENLTLTIIKPNNTTETKGPYKTAEAGTGSAQYTPTMIGTYQFQWHFPGQTIETGPRKGDYYKAGTSIVFSVTVQEDPVLPMPYNPLPTDYWQTPIYGENTAWHVLAGNWLSGQNYRNDGVSGDGYNPYTEAPNSAHILWTKQEMFGGVVSGETGADSAYTGRRPAEKLSPPIIMGGRLYYNEPTFVGVYGSASYNGFKCVDLYTGETIWTTAPNEGQYITMGQTFYHYSTAQESVTQYLWKAEGSEWSMYDAWTGRWILNITDVPSGTNYFGPHGEILRYSIDSRNNVLSMWNSTKLLLTRIRAIGEAIDWTPVQGVYNYSDGIQWRTSIPEVTGNQAIRVVTPDLILASNFFPITDTQPKVIRQDMAYDISKAPEDVRMLWIANRTVFDTSDPILGYENGIYVTFARDKLQWSGYNAYTGKQIWEAEPFDTALSVYSGINPDNKVIANGVLYNTGYDARVRAINMSTGKLLWNWFTGSAGADAPYEGWPLQGSYTGPRFADGKFFGINGEHTPMSTPWRGGRVYAIDGETGKTVWSISGTQAEAAASAIAYGKLVYLNGYDGLIYCFGKGRSATTVDAPAAAITLGSSLVIRGTVTDQSPGDTCLGIPAAGTPAIADENMSEWMEYLYQQQPKPTNATGVKVKLSVLDANGNYRTIGTTTSNIDGFFSYNWVPDIPGQYIVYASFEGSESYYASQDVTSFVVDPSAATPTPADNTKQSLADLYFIPMSIAIILVVLAVGAVIVITLRKRP